MNPLTRRSLLKAGLVASSGLFGPSSTASLAQTSPTTLPWINWSGALRCQPSGRFSPESEAALCDFLAATSGPVRPVGSGHSFSPLVPTGGQLLVIDQLSGLMAFDSQTGEATFGAGTRLGEVGPALLAYGRALHNLPDIDRQTIAGALATATHGTGSGLSCLAAYVSRLRMVTAAGQTVDISADTDRDLFDAVRVSLGALGLITAVTFKTVPRYRLHARNGVMNTADALDGFLEAAAQHRHYELFPFVHSDYSLTLAIDPTTAPIDNPPETPEQAGAFSALLAQLESVPVRERKPILNSVLSEIPASEAVDESHHILANVRNDRFNEMEYSVEAEHGAACVREVLEAIERHAVDVVFPLEVRTIRGDDTWLSMSAGEGTHVSISIHRQAGRDFRPYFDLMEPIFKRYGGRPHWGKVHALGRGELQALYPRFEAFLALRRSLDPTGRLLNGHLKHLFGES